MSRDALPNIAPPQTSIETEAPGMVAEQVEQLVTRPVESAVIGARGVAAVRSTSIQGLSVVTLDVASGANPDTVRQAITEGLEHLAGALPSGVGSPKLAPLTGSSDGGLTVGFTSSRLSPMALRDLVQWTVRPRLLSIPGVARAQIFGGEVRRIEVRARAGDLSDSDLGYADVFDAVRRATGVTGAGFIDTPNQRVPIEPRGQAVTDDDVAAGQIQVVGSAPVRISDVADVVDAPAPAFGDALIMGRPGVVMGIVSQYGANNLKTTEAVEKALAELTPALTREGVAVHADLDRPDRFVDASIRGILWELGIGVALVSVLLMAVFRDPRAALVSFVGIPLSLLAALGVVALLGWTINAMTLGGLAVALGLIVDDAVIDIENILGRLRDVEARHDSRARAILVASLEVRAPVLYATILIVVALIPVLLLSGAGGALLRPMVVSIIAAALASLIVATLLTPALALLFLDHVRPKPPSEWLRRLEDGYSRALAQVDRAPRLAMGLALAAVVLAVMALFSFKVDFLPRLHDNQLAAEINAPAATSLSVMRDYGARLAQTLIAIPGVVSVSQETGRAEGGDQAWGIGHARLEIALKPSLSSRAQDHVESQVRDVIATFPGLDPVTQTGLTIARQGPGLSDRIRVRVFGADQGAVSLAADRVAAVLASTPGFRNTTPPPSTETSVIRIDLNFQRLAIYGLSAADVLDTVQTAFEGRRAAQIYQDGHPVDIAVTAQADLRRDPEGVGDLLLRSSSGVSAPLKTVANVYLTDGLTRIEHEGGLPSQTLSVDASGDTSKILKTLRQHIDQGVAMPPGVFVEVLPPAGDSGAQKRLLVEAALSACAIFGLLLLALGNIRSSVIVLGSGLFALVGGVAAIALTGGVLSLGAFMGLLTLFGLTARNAILLISRLADLVVAEGAVWGEAVVRKAATDRLSAILISALMIAAGLAPLAIRAGTPGHEILGPMAFVILGGLSTSTLMSLFVSPAIVARFWRPGRLAESAG
jgi:CzcA family heavy metal efflux pump